MNAQSTPVIRKNNKSRALESFSELTPIREYCLAEANCQNSDIDIFEPRNVDNHASPVSKSLIEKLSKSVENGENGKFIKQLFNCEKKKATHLNHGKSTTVRVQSSPNKISDSSENMWSGLKELFDDSLMGNLDAFNIDQVCKNEENKQSGTSTDTTDKIKASYKCSQSDSPKIKVQKLDDNLLRDHIINSTAEKISEILSASDVMKWSDESLLPDLSSKIQKKLMENANNSQSTQTQGTGWTQLNSSVILNLEKNITYQKLGDFYGLPSSVKKLYEEHKGIKELYSWQKECLNLDAVKNRRNLVYALPTSGGKTLVAELLILREILCYKKNVLFILPYVSIVQEKMKDFSHLALELGFLVEEYAAGKGVIPPKKRRRRNSLLIATIEKALVIVNSLIECQRLHEFGMIVVDELHMLSEEGRGAILETILTQIIYRKENIQIIGMTATIGNLPEVGKFLHAECYVGNFRPVSLYEYVKCENKIYSIEWTSEDGVKEVRTLETISAESDPDGITSLVLEVIPNDSVLVFCATRKNCENVALLLSKTLPRSLMKVKEVEKKSLYRALISESNDQICPILRKTLPFGVAYHHSGLTAGERKLLEESFRDGTLSVICCTSTLAVGVNLPTKRVILRSPYVGRDFISLSKYKQMVGRAGRSGFGSEGESFLVCQTMDLDKVKKLLRSQMDETTSKIDFEACKDLVLSSIGLGTATTRKSLRDLLTCSLLHVQASKLNVDTRQLTDKCISSLYKQGALKVKTKDNADNGDTSVNSIDNTKLDLNITASKKSLKLSNDSQLMISRLGRAAMKGGLSLEKAHDLYGDLVKAQSSLVLLTNLHLLYLVSPMDVVGQIKPNFSLYFNAYMQLSSNEVHTAKIIGITEFVMSKLAMGMPPKNVPESVINRFYVSLMLNELWKQRTIWDVATIFQLPRGQVQTLMTSAATFANSVCRFCEELEEFWCFKSLLTDFTPRLAHCCSAELLPLMDLPAVKRVRTSLAIKGAEIDEEAGRAKQLYEAGFKTLQILAGAKPADLVRLVDHLSLKVASQIVAAAKLLLMEKAENLKEEAEDVLEGLAEQSAPKEI